MMDVLSDILASLRLTGGVVIDGQLRGDFCVLSQFTPDHCAPFFPCPETIIGYHYVRSGTMMVEVEGSPPVPIHAGEVAILPRNDPHLLAKRSGLPAIDASEVTWVTGDGCHHVACGNGPDTTEVWCGFLGTAKSSAHPLLETLPPVLKVDIRTAEEEWVEASLRFVAEQVPSPDVVSRLAESFVVQAIREYVRALPAGEGGWLAGLSDPAVARALAIIHKRYAEDLEVEELAREAGVSRSVLGERFTELLGEPPMRYCAGWRMRVAANMLRDGKDNTANIAYAVGFNSEAAFNRAFKREFGEPPATWRKRMEAEAKAAARALTQPDLPPQTVRYCRARDGTRLAFSVVGEGRPLVKTANWLNHIEYDWESPLWRHWLRELTDGHALVRYDERGNGLSDWDAPEISFEAFVDDLESVVECAAPERFDLLGISQGAAVSIAYAVRHPDRVRRMVLVGGYHYGWRLRADPEEVERREAMLALARSGWGSDNPLYRQLFTNLYVPGASEQQTRWFNEMQRRSASPENALKLQQVFATIDVRHLLGQVRVPTLVMHSRDDQAIPMLAGKAIADGIPGARFVTLNSRNHILLDNEPAWPAFVGELRSFLAED
jgi:pimeloyl-ACP methyl ester carboxylesterase/AraC-like DNA-binding protein